MAITELATTIEAESAALAIDLDSTPYEERLKLAAGFPAIVLMSADPEPARELVTRLRRRKHGVVSCEGDDVVPNGAMISLRRFAFEPDALVALDAGEARLPYDDILGLFRANHRVSAETRTEVTKSQFSVGRALLTGGLVTSKKVTATESHRTAEREQLLYLFRRSEEMPWVLRERQTHYAGLGAEAGPSSTQNFATMIAKLRKHAPRATYDERLVNPRNAPTRPVRSTSGKSETLGQSSASGVDLLAHLMALSLRDRS